MSKICRLLIEKTRNHEKGDKLDCSHRGSRLVLESQKANRARGGGKKK